MRAIARSHTPAPASRKHAFAAFVRVGALVILGIASPAVAAAQTAQGTAGASVRHADTVTVEQRVLMSPDVTPAQARRRALENALADAVRQVAGVRVQSSA
ncbi:MAG: hypothetical protein ABIZ91_11615, partial [Gemmatimonadaceae bacterium]